MSARSDLRRAAAALARRRARAARSGAGGAGVEPCGDLRGLPRPLGRRACAGPVVGREVAAAPGFAGAQAAAGGPAPEGGAAVACRTRAPGGADRAAAGGLRGAGAGLASAVRGEGSGGRRGHRRSPARRLPRAAGRRRERRSHRVKPWFTGRLDFAVPQVYGGDQSSPLSAARWRCSRIARPRCLSTSAAPHHVALRLSRRRAGAAGRPAPASIAGVLRGSVAAGGFGYVLTSDLNGGDLQTLARRIADQR